MYKEHEIIMLPTEVKHPSFAKNHIVKCVKEWTPIGEQPVKENTLSWCVNHSEGVLQHYQPQHLYILSDEQIKEGWFLNTTTNTIHKVHSVSENIQSGINGSQYHGKFECKKIIASTDKSLVIPATSSGRYVYNLPQIPQSFIEHFVEQYNKGVVIDKVMIQYTYNTCMNYDTLGRSIGERWNYRPKVNSNNTINIRPIKDSWGKEEIFLLFEKYLKYLLDPESDKNLTGKQWIEQNLK